MSERKRARGDGGVFRPPGSRFWWIRVWVNGRCVRESSRSEDANVAEKLRRRRLGEAALGKPVVVERITLDGLLALVEADYKANSRRSLDRMQQASTHLRAFLRGERKARDITADLITAYQAHRLGEKAKPSTINYELAMLRRGFRLGVRFGKVGTRPEFAMLHVDNARKGFFEREQFESILAHLPEYMKPVMTVAYMTGWRTQSELLTRQWRHIDLAGGWLRLDPGETKNGEGRMFPLTPELRAVLEQQRDRVREIERATGQIVPWVFVHPLNCPRAAAGSRIKSYRGAWATARKDAGVPDRLVHDFRRTAVRNLERAHGISRSAAMAMTGHLTESIYRRYAIVDEGMLQEAAMKLANFHADEASRGAKKVASIENQHRTSIAEVKTRAGL